MDDPYLAMWNRFADSANRWAREVAALSPASPDYAERVERRWRELKLVEKFERVQRRVEE